MKRTPLLQLLLLVVLPFVASAQIDARITSWRTANSAQYARVWETAADKTSNNAVSTWPRSGLTNGGGGQATAAYSDVQRVQYSTNYVYITTTGLASYTMGNWLTPTGQTYTSWPTNRGAIHRLPRTPSIPTTKQANHGSGGVLVNGVFVWANGDAQSYTTSTGTVSMSGQGIWNRLAGVAEAFNFDTAYGHQPSNGAYHHHINPIALRYQLGDNVSYNSATKTYSEASSITVHSPLIGWANDGLPIYGPYGYSSALSATSGVRRMTTGFQKRDGTNGTVNLATTGRVTLPVWAASVQGRSATLASTQYGPNTTATYTVAPGVTGTYSLGMFAEDYEYLGDLGKTQGVDFDLNRQNVRYCVTPEFPSGTYAYFVAIDATGATVFPDMINQEYFGSAAAGEGTVTSVSETVTEYVRGGPSAAISVSGVASGANVALSWNSAEGATYKVESSPNNSTWTTLSAAVTSGGLTTNYSATSANYYRVTLTAIATYDTNGTTGTPVGTTATLTYGVAATAPSITTQPTSATVTTGVAVTFTVAASGTAPFTYVWKKDDTAIGGATATSYSITSAQSTDAGLYTVVVTNSAGSATSSAASLTVNATTSAPAISTQPVSVTVTVGTPASFTVAASGTTPLTYQWKKNAVAISGATAATYSIASPATTDAGSYTVVVTNSAGSTTSAAATLTVTAAASAPTISTQPASAAILIGGSTSFTVVASGTAPLTYQWRKDGVSISGATSATYSITNAATTDAATYSVIVTNSAGFATSTGAILTVTAAAVAPSITAQPSSSSVVQGNSASFTVTASGTAPLTYQWRKNGTNISGATSSSLVLPNVQNADAGDYTVMVTNTAASATSSAATLTVTATAVAPSVTTQPTGSSVVAGAAVTFSVTASGSAPLTYQWYKDGTALTSGTSASYTLTAAATSDAGSYAVTVTNSAGTATSASAVLAVSAATARIMNLSTRAQAGGAAGSPIVGFVVNGSGSKSLGVRAVGPALAQLGVTNALADPSLTLVSNGQTLASNDNWNSSQATTFAAVGAFALLDASKDAALVSSLASGVYSTPVGMGSGAGLTLLEIYDLGTAADTAKLVNLSSRCYVGTGDQVVISGFVVQGEGAVRVLIRGIGPTLAASGITDALLDPQITLYRDQTVVLTNNNWSEATDPSATASAAATTGAFALTSGTKDAAMVVSLPAGVYSVVVSGVNSTTGTALVELYVVP